VKDSVLDRYFQSLGGPGVSLKSDKFNKIDITRSMVDELVHSSIRESIARCNYLIHHKLTLRDLEVHRVVMAGNGSRYRLFAEEMSKRLAVPQLDKGRMYQFAESELADLKHAVAKGVTLALASKTRSDNVQVHFDHTLSERIPFTLAYKDSERKQFIPLLREDERYDKLIKETPRLQIQPRPGSQNEVILYRHWPGDLDARHIERFWPYQVYRFTSQIKGDIKLRYDPDTSVFVLYTQQEEAKLITELVEDVEEEHLWRILASANPQLELRKVYYSPLQRGVL
jgi:hypothetical protein